MRCHSVWRSFGYAFEGLWAILKSERNMRVHLLIAIALLWFARYYSLSEEKWAITVLAIFVVLICECLNTGIERAVDLTTKERLPLAKFIKDVSAAATLLSAMGATITGFIIFFKIDIILRIINDIIGNPVYMLCVIIYIVVSLYIVRRERTCHIHHS
jgi:diacylglycerol kinase (ATP)